MDGSESMRESAASKELGRGFSSCKLGGRLSLCKSGRGLPFVGKERRVLLSDSEERIGKRS